MPARLSALLLALALGGAACTSSGTTTTAVEETTTTSTSIADGTTTTVATSDAALIAEIRDLVDDTEEIRGLRFAEEPEVTVLAGEVLEQRIRDDLAEEISEEDNVVETALLQLLGLIEPGTDLLALYQEVLGEQVAGFYDGETGELVVAGDAGSLSPLSRSIVVHELVHALQDQHFDAWDRWQAMLDEERYDEAAAYQAVIEGDATYAQTLYIQNLGPADLLAIAGEIGGTDQDALDDAPFFLQEGLVFPYDEGFRLVQRLVGEGGLAAVNAAMIDPPVSTEQVYHPSRFVDEEPPVDVVLDLAPPPGYSVYEVSTWGELGFVQLFGESSGRGDVAQVADGWGGDAYRIFNAGDEVVMVLLLAGDTATDAAEVAEAFLLLARAAVGEDAEVVDDEPAAGTDEESVGTTRLVLQTADAYHAIERRGNRVLYVAATDPVVGTALARADALP